MFWRPLQTPSQNNKSHERIRKKIWFHNNNGLGKRSYGHPEYYKGTDGVHFYREKVANDAYLKLLQKAIGESIKNKGKK